MSILDQNGLTAVFEYNVVLRIAFAFLLLNFFVELVVGVLGFPVAEGHADFMKERAVNVTAVLRRRDVLVLCYEH
ncbi:hypothetical protein ACVW0J_002750 [Bradyrhizobium sp. i1.7.7]